MFYVKLVFLFLTSCYNDCCVVAYTRTSYDSTNFFDNFAFETISDPTHGTVKFVDYTTATATGLAKYVNNKVYLGVGTLFRSHFSFKIPQYHFKIIQKYLLHRFDNLINIRRSKFSSTKI